MNTAIAAVISALSLVGVGTTAVAMSGGMSNNHPMTGDGGMGGGMMGGGMGGNHMGMQGGGHHGDCHCCGGDEGNDTDSGPTELVTGP